jgi:hypothetical protein
LPLLAELLEAKGSGAGDGAGGSRWPAVALFFSSLSLLCSSFSSLFFLLFFPLSLFFSTLYLFSSPPFGLFFCCPLLFVSPAKRDRVHIGPQFVICSIESSIAILIVKINSIASLPKI